MRLLKLQTKEEYEDELKVQVLTHQLPHIHYFLRSGDGTVVRALSSHCHGPDFIPRPGDCTGYSSFPPSTKTNISNSSMTWKQCARRAFLWNAHC